MQSHIAKKLYHSKDEVLYEKYSHRYGTNV
jgi:hypothetical protein